MIERRYPCCWSSSIAADAPWTEAVTNAETRVRIQNTLDISTFVAGCGWSNDCAQPHGTPDRRRPGTAGYAARPSAFARSTPRRTRSFSIAEIVAWEMPARFARSF